MAVPTFSNIVSQIRRVADIETDGNHITNIEIKEDFNNSLHALWAMVVNASNGSLVSKIAPKLVQLGDNSYQLPIDFLRLLSVDIMHSRGPLHSVEADPQRYAQLLRQSDRGLFFSQHYLQFNKDQGWYELFIFPGLSPDEILVRYVPTAPQLDTDISVLTLPADWLRWGVYDTAIKCNIKEETNPTPLMVERDKIEGRIVEDVRAQSPTQVKAIRDVSAWEDGGRFMLPPINYGG